MSESRSARPARRHIVVLGMLSTFGPLSLDLYLPALPELAADLGASTSAAQLTLTSCLVGLAAGQAVAGPLSDRFGRRRPLLIGLAAYALVSIACAFAGSIAVLIGLRLVQGLAGAAGLVIARAVARDLYEGRALVDLLLPAGPGRRAGAGHRAGAGRSAEPGDELARHLRRARRVRGGAAAGGLVRGAGDAAARAPRDRRHGRGAAWFRHPAARPAVRRGGAVGRAGWSIDVRLHRRVDLRAAADLRPQPAGVLAGLRGQLARPDGVCPAEWPAGPPLVGAPAPRRRAGGEPTRIARRWRSACCSASGCRFILVLAVRPGECAGPDHSALDGAGHGALSGPRGYGVGPARRAAVRGGRAGRAAGRSGR